MAPSFVTRQHFCEEARNFELLLKVNALDKTIVEVHHRICNERLSSQQMISLIKILLGFTEDVMEQIQSKGHWRSNSRLLFDNYRQVVRHLTFHIAILLRYVGTKEGQVCDLSVCVTELYLRTLV